MLLGAFANCGERLLDSSCRVFPQETTRLHLDGFSWNLIFENVSKSVKKFDVWLKYDKNDGYFTLRIMLIYGNISLNSS